MKKSLFLWSLLWLMFLPLHAQTMSESEVKGKVNQVAAQLQSMQCDFVQTKSLKLLNQKMVSKGKMYYQKSDKLCWQYVSPYNYTFVLNGAKVMLRNEKRSDVIDVQQNKMFKEIARIMMNSVLGKCLTDEKDFKVTMQQGKGEWVATLVPLRSNMKQLFQKIQISFHQAQMMVSMVKLFEKNGDQTTIQLKNIKTNAPLNAQVFSIH